MVVVEAVVVVPSVVVVAGGSKVQSLVIVCGSGNWGKVNPVYSQAFAGPSTTHGHSQSSPTQSSLRIIQ